MRFTHDGRLRRLVLVTSLGVLAALAIAGATSARVDVGSSGTASAFAGLTNDEHKVTICHAVTGQGETKNGYNIITVDKDSIATGHANESVDGRTDIIPAFAAGSFHEKSWPAFGGQGNASLIDSGCAETPPGPTHVTASVSFTDPTCNTPAGYTAGPTTGVTYILTGTVGPGNTVTVTASAASASYVLDNGPTFTHTFTAAPTNCQPDEDVFAASAVCNTATGLYDVSGTVNGEAAVATPATLPGNLAAEYNISVSRGEVSGSAAVETAGTCAKTTTPTLPVGVTFTEATCTAGPAFHFVKTGGQPLYNVDPDPVGGKPVAGVSYTITAISEAGYTFGEATTVFTHTFAAAPANCGGTPPPPPPPPTVKSDEFMDVQVVKDATAQVQLVNGQAEIAYTVRVRNNGPNQAHEVQLVDAAPSGVTFVAVTQQPLAGSCTVTSALLSCGLGTLGPGVERTIGLSARVGQTGTFVNSATATGNGKDTNGTNNTDDASTLVTAPATPPAAPAQTPKPVSKPKPKPKPHVSICRVLKVTPGMVKANGNRQLVVAKVTHSRNPVQGVAVRFSGKGLSKVVRTNAQGVAHISVAPRKAGIMLVKITSATACNTARIGVIGAFEPPVTG